MLIYTISEIIFFHVESNAKSGVPEIMMNACIEFSGMELDLSDLRDPGSACAGVCVAVSRGSTCRPLREVQMALSRPRCEDGYKCHGFRLAPRSGRGWRDHVFKYCNCPLRILASLSGSIPFPPASPRILVNCRAPKTV